MLKGPYYKAIALMLKSWIFVKIYRQIWLSFRFSVYEEDTGTLGFKNNSVPLEL